MPTTQRLADLIAPALAAYEAEVDAHARTGTAGLCRCGYQAAGSAAARGLGIHVAATHKAADKAYDAAISALISAR